MNDYLRKPQQEDEFVEVKKQKNEIEFAGGALDYVKLNAPFEIVDNYVSQLTAEEWENLLRRRSNPLKENKD